MNLNKHYELEGRHAFLSPSGYHWINYDNDKLIRTYENKQHAQRGDQLHELARQAISLGVKLPDTRKTLNMYVNDAIGFRMMPEQRLYYSEFCFGTVDAISFRDNTLRIHDLKTGTTKPSMNQLLVYTALFCLEYGFKPMEISIELRIYKSDDYEVYVPEMQEIVYIMDKIVTFDKILREIRRA